MTEFSDTTEAGEIAKRIARLEYGPARDAEIARLQAKGHFVLDIFNPRNHLGDGLAPKVAVLKAVLRIDEHGKMARPFPPQSFCNELLWWVVGNRMPARKPCRRLASPPPDGLLTPAEAARKLRISVKTLLTHVAAGEIGYVIIGRGRKRPRRIFTGAALDEFIANKTRKDAPCPSTRTRTAARRISTTTSKCEVIGFTARRNARRGVKPKK
jgi:excisionase family DNA binding protein